MTAPSPLTMGSFLGEGGLSRFADYRGAALVSCRGKRRGDESRS